MVSFDFTKKQPNETYGVSRDVSTSTPVRCIACADIASNVQDCVSATGTQNGGGEIEGVAICVVGT